MAVSFGKFQKFEKTLRLGGLTLFNKTGPKGTICSVLHSEVKSRFESTHVVNRKKTQFVSFRLFRR